ncbi:MAG: hypothetical protein P8N75_00655 [Ascidiaceihabitans sp.]|nr:hypothetical protein [Ascidiaceihabitans sp.]
MRRIYTRTIAGPTPQEALDAFGYIYHIFKLDVGTVWSGRKEALRAYMALSPIERKS